MNAFQSKYPAFSAWIGLVAGLAKGLAVQGESLVQKLEGEASQIPALVTALPLVNQLGSELAAIKQSPADIVSCAEMLISDLAFSSDKAKAVIAVAFPLAESVVGMIPMVKALVVAIG